MSPSIVLLDDGDYQPPTTFTVDVQDSETTKTIRILIINDKIFELSEEIKLSMSFGGPAPPSLIDVPETTITILDDDSKYTAKYLRALKLITSSLTTDIPLTS